MTVIFDYQVVFTFVCGACGERFMCLKHVDGHDMLCCWCGTTCRVTFASDADRDAFVALHVPAG